MADGDNPHISLIVFDTGPLITLAAADSLDYLAIPRAPVFIPDAIYYEATRKSGALGAQDIGDWVRSHPDAVRLMPTAVFASVEALRSNSTVTPAQMRELERGLGERAALEFIDTYLAQAIGGARALLIVEDSQAARLARLEPEIVVAATLDFLNAREHEARINSADAVLKRSEDAGRHASRMQLLSMGRERDLGAVRNTVALSRRPAV